jgi:hypothetical protein
MSLDGYYLDPHVSQFDGSTYAGTRSVRISRRSGKEI